MELRWLGCEKRRVPGSCSAEWVLTGTASPSPEPSPGVWSAAKTRVSMCCSPAREDRLIAKKKLWVLTSPSSPPPEPSPGVWDTADAGVSMSCTAGVEWVPCRSRIRWTHASNQTPTRSASSVVGKPHVDCSAGVAVDAAAIWVRSGDEDTEGRPRGRRSLNEEPPVRWILPCGSVCASVSGLVLAVLVPARSDRLL